MAIHTDAHAYAVGLVSIVKSTSMNAQAAPVPTPTLATTVKTCMFAIAQMDGTAKTAKSKSTSVHPYHARTEVPALMDLHPMCARVQMVSMEKIAT